MKKKIMEYAIIAGDLQNFVRELHKIEEEHFVIHKHISTQMAEVANPAYLQGVTLSAPKTITTIFVSALIEFKKKDLTVQIN